MDEVWKTLPPELALQIFRYLNGSDVGFARMWGRLTEAEKKQEMIKIQDENIVGARAVRV